MSDDEHAAGDTWTVAVTIPMSLPDELKDSLFHAIADAAYAWEPADRDGWDIDVVGTPIEAACDRWRRRAEEAEHTIARLTAERDRLRAELADVHHDLKLCVGDGYSTAASAAVEACRRVGTAEAEVERLRGELRRWEGHDALTATLIRQAEAERDEARRRAAAAETELRRLRAELKTPPEDRHALRARAAEALRDWHARRTVVCEHTQIIDYGAAADAVLAALDGRSPEPANKEGDQ